MSVPMSSGTPAIEFRGVGKRYGRQEVLRNLSLEVAAGEFFGLVGANGAGKTTAIKALLDFCDIEAGEIRLFGRPRTETAARASLAYLPERFLPPYYLTGRDFLRYMARLHRVPLADEAVHEMLERLDLARDALHKPVRQYSKGMAQKLGLAACFLSGKALLVLDEPMTGLDPKARTLVKRHLLALKRRGQTLFFSTHMLSDVEALCERMAILHQGRLAFAGTPAACCEAFSTSSLEEAYVACISGERAPEAAAAG